MNHPDCHTKACPYWTGKQCGFEVVEGRGRCRHDGNPVGLGEGFVSPLLCCVQRQQTLSLFGGASLTTADRRELTALCFGTNRHTEAASLSDRLTQSLITSGLIAGITPTSIRERLGAEIPDIVLLGPDGSVVELLNLES